MSFLTKPLKNTVTVKGKSYSINTDFRVWLKASELFNDKPESLDAVVNAIILCYKGGKIPPSVGDCIDGMADFLFPKEETRKKCSTENRRIFDFSVDAELIYASFLYDYGIDLKKENMHWHSFLALFKNLSPESPLMRVIKIRTFDASEIKDSKKRREFIKNQRKFELEGVFDEAKFAEDFMKNF